MERAFKDNRHFHLINLALIVAAFLLFVFPNSFRPVKLPMLLVIFLFGLRKLLSIEKIVTTALFSSFAVTIIYLMVGIGKSRDPGEALTQVLVVYMITPVLWIVIMNYCFEQIHLKVILKYLNIYMIFGCISVFIAIWLFRNGQRKVLELLIEDPNMTFSSRGIVEMKLFVYGSLIFFIPAFLQLEKLYEKKWIYFTIVLLCVITAIVSGRSALLLSVFIGFCFYLATHSSKKIIRFLVLGLILAAATVFILDAYGVNIMAILEGFYSKLFEGGDKARPEQTKALLDGINQHVFGAGHGVGVDYIRSTKFPWRYENVPVALIYKVSIFGFLIYSIPVIYSVYKYLHIKTRNSYDYYMLAGYFSILLATFTNPYLDSFEFNIFYVLPFIYFVKRDKLLNEKNHIPH